MENLELVKRGSAEQQDICSFQTCVIRAWDHNKPLLFCPAMNTAMWEHPVTAQQVGQLKAFGYTEVPCVAKKLVCGDQGGCPSRHGGAPF